MPAPDSDRHHVPAWLLPTVVASTVLGVAITFAALVLVGITIED